MSSTTPIFELNNVSSFDYSGLLATLIIFVGLIFLVDLISAAVRRTFREA